MLKKVGIKLLTSTIICTILAYFTAPVFAYTKDESVYSKLDNNGNVYQTIVSDHLKNKENNDFLSDLSDLINIENVGGDQEYKQENGKIVWKANGEDIYYQGETKKELPIECKISYKLNNIDIKKEEIIGKSGLVKVIFEFTNKEAREVIINGKKEIIYVPFVVGIGTVFNNEKNKNIEITSGKVIDNGNKSVVLGIATPGMQESLGIDKNIIDIPNSIEIFMDAKDFEMGEIYCFATPKIIEENDLKIFNKIDKIYYMANELKNGSNQLVQGATRLSDGANKINNGTQELSRQLNIQINKYELARSNLSNKKEIEEKIVNVINSQINKLIPELKNLAEEEAKNVVKNNLKGENGLESKTAQTALNYSKIAIDTKLNELKNNNTEINISDEIVNEIQKDIQIALKNIQNKQDVQMLENTIKNIIIKDITNTIKGKTTETVANNVKTIKNEVKDPSALLTENERVTLNKSKSDMAKAMVPGIKLDAASKGITLTDEQAYNKALSSVNELVSTVSKKTMDKTLDQVQDQTPELAENTIKEITSNLETSGVLEKAISDYATKVSSEIQKTVGKDTLNAVKINIKNEIIQEVIKSFKNDNALQSQISTKIKNEINPTIDSVAEKTAVKLANDFTEDLANQIATNLIKKQLNGELTETELDKEFSKYKNLIDSKLSDVDKSVATLKGALKELTNGTNLLADGANELQNGMNKFDTEGIQKIYNIVNNNVKDLQLRVQKLRDLSNEYKSFTSIDENAKGNVKFIMMIDSLKKEENRNDSALPEETKKEN